MNERGGESKVGSIHDEDMPIQRDTTLVKFRQEEVAVEEGVRYHFDNSQSRNEA